VQFDHDYDGMVEKTSGFDMVATMLDHPEKDIKVLIGALEQVRD